MDNYYTEDITWCTKRNCNIKNCERNPKRIRPTNRELSFADLENTEYCPKKRVNKMTPQEVIKQLNMLIFNEKVLIGCSTMGELQHSNNIEALEIAKQAVEKQIPKNVFPDSKYYGNGICPNCNAVFMDKSTNFCGNCGQALDWSDTK